MPLPRDAFLKSLLESLRTLVLGPRHGHGLRLRFARQHCNGGILRARPWRRPCAHSRGNTVVPAIVILIILAAGGGAWLGYRAGYRRGWLARDEQGPQDGPAA